MHLLLELVVLSRFQAAKFETYDNNNLVGLLPKVTKTGNFYLPENCQNWQFLSSVMILQLLATSVAASFFTELKVSKTESFQIWHFFYHNKW